MATLSEEMRTKYFKELALNLQREGSIVRPEENEFMPVDLDGCPLCLATDTGGVRYRKDDVSGDIRSAALDRVTAIIRTTAEYMRQIEAAPDLTVSGLKGDHRLLAEFNDTVLAGHQTCYGIQFITWERLQDQSSLVHGHYYGPTNGVDSYVAAKRDFATRSGLIPSSALFAPKQLAEVYRSIHETLESAYPITDERQKCLQSAAEQIERSVPDLAAQVELSNQKELEQAAMESQEDGGMRFC